MIMLMNAKSLCEERKGGECDPCEVIDKLMGKGVGYLNDILNDIGLCIADFNDIKRCEFESFKEIKCHDVDRKSSCPDMLFKSMESEECCIVELKFGIEVTKELRLLEYMRKAERQLRELCAHQLLQDHCCERRPRYVIVVASEIVKERLSSLISNSMFKGIEVTEPRELLKACFPMVSE